MHETGSRIFGGLFLAASMLLASPAWPDVAGGVRSVSGTAEIQAAGGGDWRKLSESDPVFVGDRLRTTMGSRLVVSYQDGTVIAFEPGSELILERQELPKKGAPISIFALDRGKLDITVPEGRYDVPAARFEVRTTTAVTIAHGARFTIEAE
jgi:hypothetical protein